MGLERDRCRRPIEASEVPHLLELGRSLRSWRQLVRLTQTALADELAMDPNHVWRLEAGRRRTRASTVEAIADVIAAAGRRAGVDVDRTEVRRSLIAAAGPALAPESAKSATSIDRKRKRRRRANLRHDIALVRSVVDGENAEPVRGGPELFLRRRLMAELDRAFPSSD